MPKHLFFLCPTDHLESVIHQACTQEKVFCTSLGNSIEFDTDMLLHLQAWIQEKNIDQISFILSCDNAIILDALRGQEYAHTHGLNRFYDQLARQKEYTEGLWQSCDHSYLLISQHLNQKVTELKKGLGNFLLPPLTIQGKIFNRNTETFSKIYSDLICSASVSIN